MGSLLSGNTGAIMTYIKRDKFILRHLIIIDGNTAYGHSAYFDPMVDSKLPVSGEVNAKEMASLLQQGLPFQFPEFNGTTILFSVAGSDKGVAAAMYITAYDKDYRADCADCMAAIDEISKRLEQLSRDRYPAITLSVIENFIYTNTPLLQQAHIAKAKIMLADGRCLTVAVPYHPETA